MQSVQNHLQFLEHKYHKAEHSCIVDPGIRPSCLGPQELHLRESSKMAKPFCILGASLNKCQKTRSGGHSLLDEQPINQNGT